jgi:glycoprotein-N-acetylgalactosamine 3-beta-galactosyltransferase
MACFLTMAMALLTLSLRMLQSPSPAAQPQQNHDPYALHNHPPPLNTSTVCDVPPGEGEEGPAGIRGLYKIQQALPSQLQQKNSNPNNNKDKDKKSSPRLFCMVYTHSNRHEDVLRSIVETYAPQCDGFLAASNVTDPTLGAFKVPHHGSEDYENMWNKVQAMWFFAYQNFLLDFDWFHIGGDDMYVIPDNLRRLGDHHTNEKKRPLYLGGSIPNSKNLARRFCGGGAGYTLNRYALHLLVQRMLNGECPAETAPDEDVRLGRCLEDAGVACHDTNDEFGDDNDEGGGGEVRYHHLDVQFHASWTPTRHALWLWEPLQVMHGIRGNQSQLGQISNTSVSFHLDKSIVRSYALDRGMRRYHAILYQHCGPDFQRQVTRAATCTKEEREDLRKAWMKTPVAKKKKK